LPIGLLIHPDQRHVFVANTRADLITVLRRDDWKTVVELASGREPDGMAYTPVRCKPGKQDG
jgi:hypothetical protein